MNPSRSDIMSPKDLSYLSVTSPMSIIDSRTTKSDSFEPKSSIDGEKLIDFVETRDSSEELWNSIIYIPDIELAYDKREKFTTIFKRLLGVLPIYTSQELDWQIKRITNCCLKHINDLHEIHLKRSAAIKMIEDIILRMDMFHVQIQHIVHLTWSIMSILHHFQMRFRSGAKSIITWTRQRQFQECMELYRRLISVFPKSAYPMVLKAMLLFYTAGRLWTIGRLWSVEFPLTEMICILLIYYTQIEEVIEEILTTAENCSFNSDVEPRVLIKILSEVLAKVKFAYMSNSLMKRLLDMFEKSLGPKSYHDFRYGPMKIGLKTSLMNITRNLENKDLLTLARIIELLEHTIKFNFLVFRVFLRGVYYNIKIAKFSARDRKYYKRHRTDIYRVLMTGLKNHYDIKINLDNMYTYLAIICVEIPASYVAVSIVSFAMSMQEFILRTNPPNTVACHHVHAIVMSLLSLVCYVHKAEVFYTYVTSIMERRSDSAPHLNPPLKVVYKYAQHHVLWNKSDLFFEEWEARYGLWKCFRTSKTDTKEESSKDFLPPHSKILI
ncbi:unnamed protein product [Ceutorhynchus assimilis]|uniref:Uncharacterized protein n=1 Tax=Ceutorhynchus assimilis TaxID=467358 RepID=A0A9N9N1R7_9CUCU|nr:unnamed protein product [Ceutorhynchus assimilis]